MMEESRNDQVVRNYSLISVATDIFCYFAEENFERKDNKSELKEIN